MSHYQLNSCHPSGGHSLHEVIQLNDELYNKFSTKLFYKNAIDNAPKYCADVR